MSTSTCPSTKRHAPQSPNSSEGSARLTGGGDRRRAKRKTRRRKRQPQVEENDERQLPPALPVAGVTQCHSHLVAAAASWKTRMLSSCARRIGAVRQAVSVLNSLGGRQATEYVVDTALLLLYSYAVFHDYGTCWTTTRQLQGHEYLDRDDLLRLRGRLMVVVGGKDLITPARAVASFFRSHGSPDIRLVELNQHHGLCMYTPSVASEVLLFIDSDD
eukprot:GHVU01233012.1.p1 GENE.GHVU01233012.1~~GHVU01233012.1.p1  ORF type:complete len:225 (+),score=22.87 GHVU01233012.1:26-676(+)